MLTQWRVQYWKIHELIKFIINWCFIFHTGVRNAPCSILKNTECTNVLTSSASNYCWLSHATSVLYFIRALLLRLECLYKSIRENWKKPTISSRTKEQITNHLPVEDVSNISWKILKLNAHRSSKIAYSFMDRVAWEKTNFSKRRDQ